MMWYVVIGYFVCCFFVFVMWCSDVIQSDESVRFVDLLWPAFFMLVLSVGYLCWLTVSDVLKYLYKKWRV
jgi:hypothetical protein